MLLIRFMTQVEPKVNRYIVVALATPWLHYLTCINSLLHLTMYHMQHHVPQMNGSVTVVSVLMRMTGVMVMKTVMMAVMRRVAVSLLHKHCGNFRQFTVFKSVSVFSIILVEEVFQIGELCVQLNRGIDQIVTCILMIQNSQNQPHYYNNYGILMWKILLCRYLP